MASAAVVSNGVGSRSEAMAVAAALGVDGNDGEVENGDEEDGEVENGVDGEVKNGVGFSTLVRKTKMV
nr:hypothetical protein Iba_scaffold25911CG0100 [Ipomoea batatas]